MEIKLVRLERLLDGGSSMPLRVGGFVLLAKQDAFFYSDSKKE